MTLLDIAEATAVLRRTPATMNALLSGLPDAWTTATEGPDTWSPRDVLAHVTDLEETDWLVRARVILRDGASRPFAPIDRVLFRESLAGRSVADLLVLFAGRREANLTELAALNLTEEQLGLRGRHPDPAFGEVTLAQLLAAWVVHDLTHMSQIVRVMAKRYDGTVGAWKRYLGVLNR